jgi:hypothetical protein
MADGMDESVNHGWMELESTQVVSNNIPKKFRGRIVGNGDEMNSVLRIEDVILCNS